MIQYDLFMLLGFSLMSILISERYGKHYLTCLFSGSVIFLLFQCFDVSISLFLVIFFLYVPIGILYSFWKYRHHSKKVILELKGIRDQYSRNKIIEKYHPKKMVSVILIWILIWPISIINNIISAIILGTTSLVTHTFYQVYNRIHEQAIQKSESEAEPVDKQKEDSNA